MAGRCACASAPSVGAAAAGVGCLNVTGTGTPASPFQIGTDSNCLIPIVCTSTTRPLNPATGQFIYETNTGQAQRWDGATWRPVAWGAVSGFMLYDSGALPLAAATTKAGTTTVISTTVNDPGYPYTISVGASIQVSGSNELTAWDAQLWIDGLLIGQHRFFCQPNGAGASNGSTDIAPVVKAENAGVSAAIQLKLAPALAGNGVDVVSSAGTYIAGMRFPS